MSHLGLTSQVLTLLFDTRPYCNIKLNFGTKRRVDGHPYLNTMLRYFGIKIIPFFTCNYMCEKAIEVSKTWYNVMESIDKDVTLRIKEILDQPLTWSLNNSIIYIKTPLIRATVNGYECTGRKDVAWK